MGPGPFGGGAGSVKGSEHPPLCGEAPLSRGGPRPTSLLPAPPFAKHLPKAAAAGGWRIREDCILESVKTITTGR